MAKSTRLRPHRSILKHLTGILIIATATLLSTSSPADLKHKPWVEKDWTKWGVWDCVNVLSYSPWVDLDEGRGKQTSQDDLSHAGNGYSRTLVELDSALPIRQARLRQIQLSKQYDRMNAQKKQAFDVEHAGDLTRDSDQIIVSFQYVDLTSEGDVNIRNPYSPFPVRQVAMRLGNGTLVTPIEIGGQVNETTGNSAFYVFPRNINGKPAFTTNDIRIEFDVGDVLPPVKGKNVAPHSQGDFHYFGLGCGFPIASLMYKGKLEY